MNSYLKFLSRNKLYTAIEAVGLAVSLAQAAMATPCSVKAKGGADAFLFDDITICDLEHFAFRILRNKIVSLRTKILNRYVLQAQKRTDVQGFGEEE